MIKYFCDFKGCNNIVDDQRKIHISRLNPWTVLFKFHACDMCKENFKRYLTANLHSFVETEDI